VKPLLGGLGGSKPVPISKAQFLQLLLGTGWCPVSEMTESPSAHDAVRRRLLTRFAASAACMAIPAADRAEAAAADHAPAIVPAKGYAVQEIRDGVYWLGDGAYNTMFVVTRTGVVAVDPLPTLGARYLQAIADVTDQPVTHIVYSHEHLDHIGAASLFPKDATIVAHRETAELLRRRADPRRPLPTLTFDDRFVLDVGGRTLELAYRGNNHEPGNIFINAPRQRVVMLVDVVYPGYMPYKNLGITEDVQGYIEAHRQLLAYDFDTLVAGHVTRAGTRADVETSLEFVLDLRATAASVLAATSFPAYLDTTATRALAATQSLTKWDLHNEYEKGLAGQCFDRLRPKWAPRLAGTDTYLRDNCWAMINAVTVQLPPL
jgi:glyoxylase-like metal-dependent hydrolase (beta-lactamase superfamily II)